MSRQKRKTGAGRDRTNLYSEITDRIIAELEAGRVPWVQPWGTAAAKAPLSMPKNASTGRPYSGINVLLLWGAVIERGFSGQSWLTFRQALSLGGNVRKGEHGTAVVYADRFVPEDERRRARETGEDAQAIPFLKRFTVFNTDQCENLPEHVVTYHASDLNGKSIIAFEEGCAYRRYLQEWLTKEHVVPGGTMAVGSYLAMLACVSAGAGYSVVPKSVLDKVGRRGQFRCYELPEKYNSIRTMLAWRKGYQSSKLDALREMLPVC